ncbi:MFS transporter [Terrabacter sp. NPDC000476]|uniref:MFS transporter n=1 Tax=Terrabacter sp. NPDC000476 TaxID=3154258 RepID=UPI00331CAC7D
MTTSTETTLGAPGAGPAPSARPARPARPSRRQRLALAVLALTALLLSLDVSVLYLAQPELSADLGVSTTQQLWMLDIYSFVLAGLLVTMGAVGDRIGRRRLLLVGAVAFGVASAAAAYATSPGELIVCRAVLGVAGATLTPSTMGLIRTIFPDEKQMTAAIGAWYACFMGGMALGPLVGGLLLRHFWWGSAFLLGVPFMVLLVVVGPRVLPESERRSDAPVDVLSAALSLGAILPVIYGFKEVARGGSATVAATSVGLGAALGLLFLRRQRRIANPLVDLTLFRSRVFAAALAVMLVGGVVMAGVSYLGSQWLQLVAGLDPLGAGLWMLPANVALLAGSALSARVAGRLGTGPSMAGGLLLCAAGLVLHTQLGAGGGLGLLVLGMCLTSFGIMVPSTLTMGLMMRSAPPERAGAVASLSETSAEFGIAVGVAGLGSLATLVYRGALGPYAGTRDAGAALDSLAGALRVADGLPGPAGRELAAAAQDAFSSGLAVVAWVGVLLFAGCAVAITRALRRGPNGDPLA